MPVEKGRTTANKTIVLPTGGTVLVPVITQINFVDSVDRAQESDFTVDNTAQSTSGLPTTDSDRKVHVDLVNTDLAVERVDTWCVKDPVDRAQESHFGFDNTTYDPNGPPFFTRHYKTHVVRYQNDPDTGDFVDSELIDEFHVLDSVDRAQESDYVLNNPPGTDDGTGNMIVNADPTDPDITDTPNGIDPPWRLDPFQNIVGYGSGYLLQIYFSWSDLTILCYLQPPLDQPPTYVSEAGVHITADTDWHSYTKLVDVAHTYPNPGAAASYDQLFVWDIPDIPPLGQRASFNVSLSGQGDETSHYVVFTHGPGSWLDGVTELTFGALSSSGPWPSPGFSLYSKGLYKLVGTSIVPKDPHNNPGPISNIHTIDWFRDQIPNTDRFYYHLDEGTGTITPPFVAGGPAYTLTGLFKDGSCVIELERLPDYVTGHTRPTIWPSAPAPRGVEGSPMTSFSTNEPPPPPYNFGLYRDINGIEFYYGQAPVRGHYYTGTTPPYSGNPP